MARQVQTVLVSIAAHLVALFLLVVIPLLAMEGLPSIPSLTTYMPAEVHAPEPPAPPQRAAASVAQVADVTRPPTEAPRELTPEHPEQPPMIAALPGVDGGTGAPGSVTRLVGDAMNVAPPPQKETEPVRPGGNVKAPARTTFVPPVYPPIALTAHVSGTVIIEAVIGVDGSVRDAKVLRSIPLLDVAALAAVRQWHYTPTTLNGIPVPVVMTVSVRFEIGG